MVVSVLRVRIKYIIIIKKDKAVLKRDDKALKGDGKVLNGMP